ncbi:MAG: PqiC family protein [Desulfococcaceae bacterium]|jgi:uncharacterized lipoprotein YmbA|nr:PqiC family protein [Desulfococcaceae bacterium]
MKVEIYKKYGLIFCLPLFLASCLGNAPPVQFYTLTSLAGDGAAFSQKNSGEKISLGIGPLEIPKMLDRSQIVTRSGENRLHLAEFHRWGGSLSDDFLRVLAENLAVLLHSDQVLSYPWRDFSVPRYCLRLKLQRFDAGAGEKAVLAMTWALTDTKGGTVLKRSFLQEKVAGGEYTDIVAAQSRLLLRFSMEIAGEISARRR